MIVFAGMCRVHDLYKVAAFHEKMAVLYLQWFKCHCNNLDKRYSIFSAVIQLLRNPLTACTGMPNSCKKAYGVGVVTLSSLPNSFNVALVPGSQNKPKNRFKKTHNFFSFLYNKIRRCWRYCFLAGIVFLPREASSEGRLLPILPSLALCFQPRSRPRLFKRWITLSSE